MINKKHEYLEYRGYVKYNQCYKVNSYSDYFYQKKISDNKGIKYFLNLLHWSNVDRPDSWAMILQINEPFYVFEQHNIELKDLDKLEEKCSLFFKTMGCEYYEKY